jgi:Uma2 family endonuclease
MSGGTPRHSKLKSNVTGLFWSALGNGPCQAYDADLKVRVRAAGLAAYPDLTVICGPLQADSEDPNAVTNPTLVVEVLSPTTELWDRGKKFTHYRSIPTLKHYLLVSQDTIAIEHYERGPQSVWLYTSHGPGESIALSALGVSLDVDAVYRNLPD